jgi:hypothetical protein
MADEQVQALVRAVARVIIVAAEQGDTKLVWGHGILPIAG